MEDNIGKERVIRFISSKDNTTLGVLKKAIASVTEKTNYMLFRVL